MYGQSRSLHASWLEMVDPGQDAGLEMAGLALQGGGHGRRVGLDVVGVVLAPADEERRAVPAAWQTGLAATSSPRFSSRISATVSRVPPGSAPARRTSNTPLIGRHAVTASSGSPRVARYSGTRVTSEGQVAAGRVPTEEDAVSVAAVAPDVGVHPCDAVGDVLDLAGHFASATAGSCRK